MSREDKASWFGVGYTFGGKKYDVDGNEEEYTDEELDILEATRAQDIFGAINTQLAKRPGGGNGQ